jgi:ATP-binding cassette subfamily F protein uup
VEQRKPKAPEVQAEKPKENKQSSEKKRMSYKEQIEFNQLEKDIALLESEKEELSAALSKGDLSNDELITLGQRIGVVVEHLDTKTNRWIELAELA